MTAAPVQLDLIVEQAHQLHLHAQQVNTAQKVMIQVQLVVQLVLTILGPQCIKLMIVSTVLKVTTAQVLELHLKPILALLDICVLEKQSIPKEVHQVVALKSALIQVTVLQEHQEQSLALLASIWIQLEIQIQQRV